MLQKQNTLTCCLWWWGGREELMKEGVGFSAERNEGLLFSYTWCSIAFYTENVECCLGDCVLLQA